MADNDNWDDYEIVFPDEEPYRNEGLMPPPELRAPAGVISLAGPGPEELAYTRPIQTGIGTIAKGADIAGRALRGLLGAYSFEAIGEPELQAQQLGATARQMGLTPPPELSGLAPEVPPLEEGMRQLPLPARIAAEIPYGIAETTPRLAAVTALQAGGVPAPLGAAAVFGATEEGFDPRHAAIAALLPVFGQKAGKYVEALAQRLGVGREGALLAINKLGGAAGAGALLAGVNEAELVGRTPEEKEESRIKSWANIAGMSLLGAAGHAERPPEVRGRTTVVPEVPPEAKPITEREVPSASSIEKAAKEDVNLPAPPREGVREVPVEEGGRGVQPPSGRPQEGQAPSKVPLAFDEVKASAEKLFPGIEVKQAPPNVGIEISADGKTLNLSPNLLRDLSKEYGDKAMENFQKLVQEEVTHHRHLSRLGEGFNDKLAEIWNNAPKEIQDLTQRIYGKQPGMEAHHWGAELLRMADQAKNTGDITETMHRWNADKAREAVGPLKEWAESQTGEVGKLFEPEPKTKAEQNAVKVEESAEPKPLETEVSDMSPGEFFDRSQEWAKGVMAGESGATGPQIRAEQAATSNPNRAQWQAGLEKAQAEATKIRDEIKANPSSMMARQKEMMGAGQKVQFFSEGLKIIDGIKNPEATKLAEVEPPATEATREPELATQLAAGVPDPIATYRSAVKAAGEIKKSLTPAAKSTLEYSKKIGDDILKIKKLTDFNRAIVDWSGKQQTSFSEASKFQKRIQNVVKNPVVRDGITNWIQANGDKNVLRDRASKSSEELRPGYEAALNLTPEEIKIAQEIKNTFDTLAQRGQFYGILDNFKDNYVTQIWNLRKGPTFAGTRTLRDQFRFNKARSFESYFEGEQNGFVPKTKDISKILPMYLHEMNNVIAARQLVEAMSKGKASDGRPLLSPRGNEQVVGNPGDQAVLVNPRGLRGQEKLDTRDYNELPNQPALQNWIWSGKDTAGNPVFIKANLAVHPEAFTHLSNVLGKSKIREWYQNKQGNVLDIPKALVHGIDAANTEGKAMLFGLLAPFHQVQEGQHAVGHRVNPFRIKGGGVLDIVTGGKAPKALKMPEIDLVNNAGQQDAARHGLMLLPDRASAEQFMSGFGGSKIISKIPGIGKLADMYQNYLFKEYIPGLKYLTYESILKRNNGVYSKELASGEVSPSDVKALSATQANAAYGHLNYTELGRNPTFQHFLQLALIAPDFLEARARFTGQAIKGATGAKVGREQLIALGLLAAAQAGVAYTVAKAIEGEWDWKHPFEVVKGNRKYTLRSVPEDLARFADPEQRRAFISARLGPVPRFLEQFRTGIDWRGQKVTAGETLKEIASQPVPLTIRPLIGEIPGSDKYIKLNSPLSAWEQLAGSVGLKISRFSHADEVYNLAQDWKKNSGDPKLVAEYERAERTTNPESDYKKLRDAIDKGSDSEARAAYSDLLKIKKVSDIDKAMRPYTLDPYGTKHFKPFSGSAENEAKFKKSLNKDDMDTYERAVKERKARYQGYLDFKKRLPHGASPILPPINRTVEFPGADYNPNDYEIIEMPR